MKGILRYHHNSRFPKGFEYLMLFGLYETAAILFDKNNFVFSKNNPSAYCFKYLCLTKDEWNILEENNIFYKK